MTKRNKLIEYLDTHCIDSYGELQTSKVASFILKDRQRIFAHLVKFNSELHTNPSDFVEKARIAIDKTLQLAGETL